MTTEELIFTIIIFLGASFYIFKSLFKKNGCGSSCGCASSNKKEQNKKKTDAKHC